MERQAARNQRVDQGYDYIIAAAVQPMRTLDQWLDVDRRGSSSHEDGSGQGSAASTSSWDRRSGRSSSGVRN